MRPLLFLLCLLALRTVAGAVDLPDYFQRAFAQLGTDAPRGWAYTLRTTRDGAVSVERFDPSRPKGGEWTLLERDGRAPDADDLERYLRYKAANTPQTRATFEKGDVDLGSVVLAREDGDRAEFQAIFRGDVSAPLLAHLALVLVIDKQAAVVERTELRLRAPFSSGLGMRMQELVVTTHYDPPVGDRPSLPRTTVSKFRGRMFFFVSVEEDLRVEFSDFARVK